jgi:UDP-3-O-[3-hydroxymyristoyl] glucosamine N-acyltransferase
MAYTLGELARRFDCRLSGGGDDRTITGVASLDTAGPDDITFLANPKLRVQLAGTLAAAVILDSESEAHRNGPCLVTANPYASFVRVAELLHPEAPVQPGIHPGAVIASSAVVAESARVDAGCVIGESARIGERAWIGPGCVIGEQSAIGADSRLHARVTVYPRVRVGERTRIHAGVVLGADGFGLVREEEGWLRVPHLGGLRIGDDVDIGANTTIDRGTLEDTVIGNGVKLDNLIQIAHNVIVGDHTVMAACVGIAGSTRVGERCLIGGRANLFGHITIGDDATIAATSAVTRSVPPGGYVSSVIGAQEAGRWRRTAARVHRIEELASRIRALEQRMDENNGGREE